MRTTHPEITSNDNLTIGTAMGSCSHYFRRPQHTPQECEPEAVSQSPVEPAGDCVELSNEYLFNRNNRGEELCSNLLAAWA